MISLPNLLKFYSKKNKVEEYNFSEYLENAGFSKKDAEDLLAAAEEAAARENALLETEPEVQEEAPQVVVETLKRSAMDIEKIISEAEEAAFNGEE